VNSEERRLTEMLHRVTPEPPRRVTVEDVAFRLASEAGRGRPGRGRPGRGHAAPRPPRRRRGWVPALAALAVFAVAGTSAGIATVLTSHNHAASPTDGKSASASASGSPSATASTRSPASTETQSPASLRQRIAGGIWGAELINRQSFGQLGLTAGAGSLYAVTGNALVRIDPATGTIVRSTSYNPPFPTPPVVLGNTVWVVWSYHGGNVVLHGYDAQTLAQVSSVLVPAIGGVSSNASGVLAAAPGGQLYVAAGDTVALFDPASGQIVRRIYMPADPASSVAVSPDGSKLYVGTNPANSFRLLVYDLASGVLAGSSKMSAGGAGNLVATSGGVWGTGGSGHSEWVWFAPAGDLSRSFRVGEGAEGGLASLPALSGGAVWVGGSHQLLCANPATGLVRASTAIPADHGTPEKFSVVTVLGGGRAYALYQDVATNLSGLATLTPPAACSG